MSYQHGAGAEIGNDKVKSAVQVDTVVAYIGTAPINLVLGYKEKGLINTPIKLENMPKTQATVGYSSNWNKFTLCEPFDCHFANTIGNVGPIYMPPRGLSVYLPWRDRLSFLRCKCSSAWCYTFRSSH